MFIHHMQRPHEVIRAPETGTWLLGIEPASLEEQPGSLSIVRIDFELMMIPLSWSPALASSPLLNV